MTSQTRPGVAQLNRWWQRTAGFMLSAVFCVQTIPVYANTLCPDADAPRQAVMAYLTAMQEHRFSDAYDHVTVTMTDGLSREQWSARQKLFYTGGEVNIYGIDARPAVAAGEDSTCASAAQVANILRSRDRFNHNGLVEFETYRVVKNDNQWRVDAQQTLYDTPQINQWFPDVELVEVPSP